MTKICPVCDKEFDTEYVRQIYCSTECKKIAARERSLKYYYDHLDSCRLKKRKYNQSHKEQLREYAKNYAKNHAKKYRQDHKEKISNYQKEYYRKNKERISKYKKDWYQGKKLKTKIAECSKKYNDCFNCPTENGECLYD